MRVFVRTPLVTAGKRKASATTCNTVPRTPATTFHQPKVVLRRPESIRKIIPAHKETNGVRRDKTTTAIAGMTIGSSVWFSKTTGPLVVRREALQLQQLCWVEKLLAPHAGHNRRSLDIFPSRRDAQGQQTYHRYQSGEHHQSGFGQAPRSTSRRL